MYSKFSKQAANKRLKIVEAAREKSKIVENELIRKLNRLCGQQESVKSAIEFIEKLESSHLSAKHLDSKKLILQCTVSPVSPVKLRDIYIRSNWMRKICFQLESDKKTFANLKNAGEKLVAIKSCELAKERIKSAKMNEILRRIKAEVAVACEVLEEIEKGEANVSSSSCCS